MNEAQLRTVWQQRQMHDRTVPLSEPLTQFVKRTLARRVRQLSRISELWDELVPEEINRHTALEGFQRGVLSVMVDSASHRFQLRTLLASGLQEQLQSRFDGTLRKVRLVPGQFYAVDLAGRARYEF